MSWIWMRYFNSLEMRSWYGYIYSDNQPIIASILNDWILHEIFRNSKVFASVFLENPEEKLGWVQLPVKLVS